jgi:hypothetical protein
MEDFSSVENRTWWIYCKVHTPGRVGGSVPDPQCPYTFLGLPDPLVRGPDPDPFILKQNSEKIFLFPLFSTSL